jgi:hypothetical protein
VVGRTSRLRIAVKWEHVAEPRETAAGSGERGAEPANTRDIGGFMSRGWPCRVAASGFMLDGVSLMGSRRCKHSVQSNSIGADWCRLAQRQNTTTEPTAARLCRASADIA